VYEKYHSKGFELLSVNASWDKDAPARKFVEDHRLPFRLAAIPVAPSAERIA